MGKKQVEQLAKLSFNKKLLARIAEIRTKYAIPSKGISDNENMSKWNRMILRPHLRQNGFNFSQEIYQLLRDFKLSEQYFLALLNFTFFNEFPEPSSPLVVEQRYDKKTKQVECRLQIFGDTTIRDIEKVWSEIKKIQAGKNVFYKKLPGYQGHYKPLINLVRDAEIRRLREIEELSLTDTRDKINKLFPQNTVAYQDISHIIERHKRAIGEEN